MEYNNTDKDLDIKESARQLLKESGILEYIDEKSMEQVFSNIHILKSSEELRQKEDQFLTSDESIEGFNMRGHIFVGPQATPHTIIREFLKVQSKITDENGRIIKKGIIQIGNNSGERELNDGILEYLTAKISGDISKYHHISSHIFKEIEPLMIKHTGNPNILMETLLKNGNAVHEFISRFSVKDFGYQILYGLEYTDEENANECLDDIKARFKRHCIKEEIKTKIKQIFMPKGKKELQIDSTKVPKPTHRIKMRAKKEKNHSEKLTKEEEWRKSQQMPELKKEDISSILSSEPIISDLKIPDYISEQDSEVK